MAIFKIWDGSTWVEVPIEDPTLYLLLDGTRAMTGALDMGANAITNVGNVDGRDVSVDGAKLDIALTAAAVITDHAVVRGAGGSRGVQGSGVLINDLNEVSGVAKLTMSGDIDMGANNIKNIFDLVDVFGNTQLGLGFAIAAVNYITLYNSQAGLAPSFVASGSDANVDLVLASKGTGKVNSATNHKFTKGASYDAVHDNGNVDGNIVIDWAANGNVQKMTLTGNVTQVLFTNPPGPCNCRLWIYQDGTGGRTIADNWDADVYWGGTAPVVSADASNFDVGVFEYDGASTYAAQLAQGIDGLGFNPP